MHKLNNQNQRRPENNLTNGYAASPISAFFCHFSFRLPTLVKTFNKNFFLI